MKRAHALRPYRKAHDFPVPDGVVTVSIDPATGKRSAPACGEKARNEIFIAGTEPLETCDGSSPTTVSSWTDPDEESPQLAANAAPVAGAAVAPAPVVGVPAKPAPARTEPKPKTKPKSKAVAIDTPEVQTPDTPAQPQEKRKGIFGRLGDIFK
jgi:hypothetical protein